MKGSSIFNNISHSETSYDAIRVCIPYILQGLLIFRYSECRHNDLISHL